jgi:homoserine O-succinyltransferase/O-acetyltransferase
MPLIFDADRVPPRWAAKGGSTTPQVPARQPADAESIRIALINNMPDPALEDTESQFFELLDAAAGHTLVHVELYSLPKLTRGDRTQDHLRNFYMDFDGLWDKRFDGIVVTGTEPRQSDLRAEPYWPALVDVLDWAEHSTSSAVLSCLAAHAGVLYSDGITRHLLQEKCFGVFAHDKVCEHPLTHATEPVIHIPHSRWNELHEDALTSCGYQVLTRSPEAGVDLFTKEKGGSLFVHFQGHPEYEAETLLKEYRRDIKRYLKHERKSYPCTPHAYFESPVLKLLDDFRAFAESNRREEIIERFPHALADALQDRWHSSAVGIYRNWLNYLISNTARRQMKASVRVCGTVQAKDRWGGLARRP